MKCHTEHRIELRFEEIEDRCSDVCNFINWEKITEKGLDLNGVWTHDFCDAGAVLYQLSYQANWDLPINPKQHE